MYEFEEMLSQMQELIGAGEILGLISSIQNLLVLTAYILSSIGLYSLADRRGIHNAWLSWIPVGNLWILGSLADQYRYVSRRDICNKRKVLLTLGLLQMGSAIVFSILLIISIFTSAMLSADETAIFATAMILILVMVLTSLGLGLATVIISYIALHDVFKSTSPENATLFTVLSILFMLFLRVYPPFFLFFERKKDTGMSSAQPRQPAPCTMPPYTPDSGSTQNSQNGAVNLQKPQASGGVNLNKETPEPWTQNQDRQEPWNQDPEQL